MARQKKQDVVEEVAAELSSDQPDVPVAVSQADGPGEHVDPEGIDLLVEHDGVAVATSRPDVPIPASLDVGPGAHEPPAPIEDEAA